MAKTMLRTTSQEMTTCRHLLASTNDQLSAGYLAAGLPNITGTIEYPSQDDYPGFRDASGALSLEKLSTFGESGFDIYASGGKQHKISFKASNSSSIYGATNTVRPPSIPVTMWKRTA